MNATIKIHIPNTNVLFQRFHIPYALIFVYQILEYYFIITLYYIARYDYIYIIFFTVRLLKTVICHRRWIPENNFRPLCAFRSLYKHSSGTIRIITKTQL